MANRELPGFYDRPLTKGYILVLLSKLGLPRPELVSNRIRWLMAPGAVATVTSTIALSDAMIWVFLYQ